MNPSQLVADLRWAIGTPSLIVDGVGPSTIEESLIDERELAQSLDKRTDHRVGRYFERLIYFWLTRIRRLDAVRFAMPLKKGNRTIGELDFLFRDESGDWTHMETAVKFFLQYSDPQMPSCYVGPNPSDHFEKKYRRLIDHQLPLSRSAFPEVRHRLPLVKGRIFYHRGKPQDDIVDPAGLAPDHLRGTWIHRREWDWLRCRDRDHRYLVLEKPHWLAPPRYRSGEPRLSSIDRLRQEVDHSLAARRAVQASCLKVDGGIAEEIDRLFIVPDDWPHQPGQ